MIYLAAPYSHQQPLIENLRVQQASKCAVKLMLENCDVFSPITYGHATVVFGAPRLCYEEWIGFGLTMLGFCDQLWVLKLDGWQSSKGIIKETVTARNAGKPVYYLDPAYIEDNTHASFNRYISR